ncbi:MAG: hypothetical protein CMJ18_15680 [Phycisphaeraceae bacterium]|nr:hypothetical protein [Phycisphaeraceae bacterium]
MIRFPVFVVVLAVAGTAFGLDAEPQAKAHDAIERGIAYLRKQQAEDGSWSPRPGPAITAMAVAVMLDQPGIGTGDPEVAGALGYILRHRKPDGGIHGGFLQNYNTAICLSALSRVRGRADAAEAVAEAQGFLRGLQWHGQKDPNGRVVDPNHPYFGGAGYGSHGRPDLSNTQVMLQGLHDSGVSSDDPAYRRALVFISRCQGTAENDMFADRIEPDGGFIYATSTDKDHVGTPETKAGPIAGPGSRLRTYGSMTYAGFKSYVYADLDRDDARVVDAYRWICRHYTLDRNPGLPEQRKLEGYYYYLMTVGRALDAWGATFVHRPDGTRRDWANDLIETLVGLQRPDGSWVNESSRWMEKDPNLVTCYALIALTHAAR